jgi:uncharacterized repeat protein (TIGR02543 family)
MKKKLLSISVCFAILLTLLTSISYAERFSNSDEFEIGVGPEIRFNGEPCRHSVLYDFDDSTMIVNGVFEGNTVEALLQDVANYADNHRAVIMNNGQIVADGYLETGMIVRVFHGRELYGEYTVGELLEPFTQFDNGMMLSNSTVMSSISVVQPICNIRLSQQSGGGNLTCTRNCTCRVHGGSHDGIDIVMGGIYGPGIYGTPIRAIATGTVTDVADTGTTGRGRWVGIDHGNGIRTIYAHMNSAIVNEQSTVSRGQIIGYVGNTGRSTAPHLHFAIYVNGSHIDPLRQSPNPTIQGAPSHTNITSTHRVDIRANGGVFWNDNVTRAQSKTPGVPLPLAAPTRTGFTHIGWANSANATVTTFLPNQMYTADSTATFHAVWRNNNNALPRITFNLNGTNVFPTSIPQATTGANGRLTQLPTPPTRPGFRFAGWFNSDNIQLTTNTAHSQNTTYTARWTADSTFIANGTYIVRNRFTGLNLDVRNAGTANGTQVQQWNNNNNPAQHWVVTRQSNGTYTLNPAHATNLFLDIDNAGTANGTRVQVRTATGHAAQRFNFQRNADGFFNIMPSHANNTALEVTGNPPAPAGAPVVLWQLQTGWWSQQWEFIRVA